MADSQERAEIEFDGRTIPVAEGQSIAGALHAAGEHLLSRSFKYHRPRGLLCCAGRCPNCLCTVDGVPNVRICTTPARPGAVVKSQNAWPSRRFDLLSILNRLDRFMPVGFYYKQMYKPRWMWPIWEKFIRRIAGLGSIDRQHGGEGEYDKLNLFTDVAVVGGGWAGLHAALAAAEGGVKVILIDDQPVPGGHLRHDPDLAGSGLAELVERVRNHPGIERLASATVFGCYEGNYLGIQQGQRMVRLRARQVVIATGGWERPLVFENNDLPGVLLASGVQRLLHLEHGQFGGGAVVVTDNSQGYRVARQLMAAGTRVAAIVDIRRESADAAPADCLVLRGRPGLAARGTTHVESVAVGDLSGKFEQVLECRWLAQAVGFTPANSLLYQNGCKLTYDPQLDQARVTRYAEGMHSAGAVNGAFELRAASDDGRRAGLQAAAGLRPLGSSLAEELRGLESRLESPNAGQPVPCPHYVSPSDAKKKFVCLCEDVTEKDLCDAVREGYSNIETLKRYSTISMGPCQGKMCQGGAIALCARENGQSIEATGVTTARPPEQPIPLGLLAGRALHFSLVRRTALHDWHVAHGATMMDAGNWKRPQLYTSVDQEYAAVRNRAGLIDVSTLGKIELRGRDVVRFLEFIYPNRFENLRVGRVRYGVICDDAGILLDDGAIARLEPERFFLTTTTGNADAIDSWFRSWLVGKPELDVQMTNVSGSYAAMNLAGPHAREILEKLTDADLSPAAMPYLAANQCQIAGARAIVLRIGFVGESGYEIHVPAQQGLAVWEALVAAGGEFGLEPFGIETQRLLRLEKKHLLPGVDTDALSNPIEADLPWIVKFEKDDFIGRQALARVHARQPRQRLVGFRLHEAVDVQPASLVLHEGRLGGRVTSCSYSPAAGTRIGLAWVPAECGKNGDRIQIQVNGRLVTAIVQDEPFYDPAGERLKS
ncbi:MAG: 2Fe-2S iron-sulfur cluster-binding protein [Planctomycetales bacterium]